MKQGSLLKWTNMMKGYQQRWFVLDEINGLLCYYTSPEKMIRADRRGYIRLEHAIMSIEDEDDTTFSILNHVDHKVFYCKADSSETRDEWINCLTDFKHSKYGGKTLLNKSLLTNKPCNVDALIEEFNKKLIETDQYLQILIKQFQKLELRIKKSEEDSCQGGDQQTSNGKNAESSFLTDDNDRLDQLRILRDRSVYFLDSIKHTIVLLQIAKNIRFPVNGIYPNDKHHSQNQQQQQKNVSCSIATTTSASSSSGTISSAKLQNRIQQQERIEHSRKTNFDDHLVIAGSKKNSINNGEIKNSEPIITGIFTPSETTSVVDPTFNSSKSSTATEAIDALEFNDSEDDDDASDDYFFDANDESNENSDGELNVNYKKSPSTEMPIINRNKSKSSSSSTSNPGGCHGGSSTPTTISKSPTGEIDYDKIYDSDGNDNDDDVSIIASHGSVISHLLAQVKIGMDLTKVALPTFILERRSLLEMYADFFAHADLFCSIPNYKTPQERMIQVTKWYLSAFHAGRKGSIAKKPYNPILGEVFKCYWNLSKDSNSESMNEGPVPWAKTSDLIFVAEQVSHHPPISAFYAESVDKRIMCSAQIWTKSKFLGLSIGVNNIGQGSLYLLDHGEEYVCTFPSAYGRSILTEPWFEMGGSVQLECQKTGYSAKIDFLTKPFYGGKKHRINAEVYEPNNKKVLVTITGEWNGKMEAKWSTGSSKPELFIDTKTMPIVKKQVRPISEQEEFESRNLWKKVTVALKRQDVNEASTAKYNIEQKQRDLVKEREENGIKWQNRMFHNVGEKWLYNNPLTKRIRPPQTL